MSRRRPDGVELHWRLTSNQAAEDLTPADRVVPFVIDWGATETPARSAPRLGRLAEFVVAHPDPGVVDALTALDVTWGDAPLTVVTGGPALSAVIESGDSQRVELS